MSVRTASSDDVPTIVRLYLEVADEVVTREPSFRQIPDADEVDRRYRARVEEATNIVVVALVDGIVVGFVDAEVRRHHGAGTYHQSGIDIWVEELIVTTSHRRRGVATALMDAVESWAREEGARTVWLDTHLTNEAARALYGALGYREVGVEVVKEL